MVSEKSEITCLAAQDWKSFIQSRSKEMKKGEKVKKETITLICQSLIKIGEIQNRRGKVC